MIKQCLNVEGYWTIVIYYKPDRKDYKYIIKDLTTLGCSTSDINSIKREVFGKYNTGFTTTNLEKRYSIVCINKTDSTEQFINTIVHEAKHIQSSICKYYNVSEHGEKAAYLIGYLIQNMYRVFKELM